MLLSEVRTFQSQRSHCVPYAQPHGARLLSPAQQALARLYYSIVFVQRGGHVMYESRDQLSQSRRVCMCRTYHNAEGREIPTSDQEGGNRVEATVSDHTAPDPVGASVTSADVVGEAIQGLRCCEARELNLALVVRARSEPILVSAQGR